MHSFRALVLDSAATSAISQADIQDVWFDEFLLPPDTKGLKRIENNGVVYIVSNTADETARLFVIPTFIVGALSNRTRGFDRILHIGLAHFDRRVSIPVIYQQFNYGSLVSIYAYPFAVGEAHRIYFDRSPRGQSHNIYVYAHTQDTKDISAVQIAYDTYDVAVNGLVDALLSPQNSVTAISDNFGIQLSAPLSSSYIGSASLDEWYGRKLTNEQRALVDKDLTQPVRLRGAAGTGKTVALVVKCVREALRNATRSPVFRIAFVTHSHALAHDVVRSMIDSLDPRVGQTGNDLSQLWLGSLYELAQQVMQYERKGLRPLSTDGREGREFQSLLIGDAIQELESDAKFVFGERQECSERFRAWLSQDRRDRFIVELMNEFATSIDADNVRLGNAAAEKYMRQKRDSWQFNLENETDRKVVLMIHDSYCRQLEASRVLSMDQMISDFNRYLETHEWRQLKEAEGYDLIFVDELHYFNKMERMVFHSLFRTAATSSGQCPLFMAYDLKQSINDTMLNYAGGDALNIFVGMKAGTSDIVELTKVFRSTPAISEFLESLDGAFPALGLGADWGSYPEDAEDRDGEVPCLTVEDREVQAIDRVFSEAREDAKRYGGRSVAVLCTDEDAFDKYIKLGRIAGKFELIGGRDQLNRVRYAGARPIFSTPDYVAGMQFSSVYLLNVESYQESVVDRTLGERRRFVSRVYVGASRAADKLAIVVSKEKGGPAELLNGPIQAGKLARNKEA